MSGEESETTRYREGQLLSACYRVRNGPTARGVIAESAGNGSVQKTGAEIRAACDTFAAKYVAIAREVAG